MSMRHTNPAAAVKSIIAIVLLAQSGCATTFPTDPTPDELEEMHTIMSDCMRGIIPLETRYSRTCQNVEDALNEHYGGLDAFLAALKARQ